ncbi:MAG TPA: VWA domain-containing protein [Terriglobia bacterium]|nr:VWA domain-containing protein [Terriglobia bacterium]
MANQKDQWIDWRALGVVTLVLLMSVVGCRSSKAPEDQKPAVQLPPGLLIWAGSENRSLESLVQEFARRKGTRIEMAYYGSGEIAAEISKGAQATPDAIWPASSIWIAYGDRKGVVRQSESIMRSPMVLGVRLSAAKQLGWVKNESGYVGHDITIADLVKARTSGRLQIGMTSATQSNSGCMAYLGFLYALSGNPEILEIKHVRDEKVGKLVSSLLGGFQRSAGSTGFLMDLLLERPELMNAVFTYESLLIETNQKLASAGKEPLYAIYLRDGTAIADSPLALINKGQSEKEAFFKELQQYLLSNEIQQKILASGRRTGLLGMNLSGADTAKFNPAWGIDLNKVITPIAVPSEPVIREALYLYQVAFRKPSLTVFVLDFSGSMGGNGGEQELKQAMRILLTPELAAEHLLQPSPRDISIVIPFSNGADQPLVAKGNDMGQLMPVLTAVETKTAGGGTSLYHAAAEAFRVLNEYAAEAGKYHMSVIVMTDGEPTDSQEAFTSGVFGFSLRKDVPIYPILFGSAAKKEPMEWLVSQSYGKVFDGSKDLAKAMREAKGYN